MWFVYFVRWIAPTNTTKPVNKSPAWNIPTPQSPPTSPTAASPIPPHPNTSSKTQRHAQQQSYNSTQQQSITTADHNARGQTYVTVQQQDGQSASVMRSPANGQQMRQNQQQQNQRQQTTSAAAVNLQDIMSQEAEEMEALQRYANKPLSSVQV